MKKSDLIKIIELVVRKEVKKQVKQILITERVTKQPTIPKAIPPKPKPKPKVQQQYTSNVELNKVLNETVGLNSKSSDEEEWPSMGGGTFDSSKMAETLGYGAMSPGGNDEVKRQVGAVETMKAAGVTSEQVPEGVVNALTKDYRSLMKHINKQKGK